MVLKDIVHEELHLGPEKGGNRAYTTIRNNKFKNISSLAIDCYHSDSVQIKDNIIAGSLRGIFIDGYHGKVEGNIITYKWKTADSSTFIYEPTVGIYNEESYNCIFTNNIIRDCTQAGMVLSGGTCGCIANNNTFCYNYSAFEINENYVANNYNSVKNFLVNNQIDACYGPVFNIVQAHNDWTISNNNINIWGLNNEEAQPAFYLQKSFQNIHIKNNVFSNNVNSYTEQYKTAGNVLTLIKSIDNNARFSGEFIDNHVEATFPHLFDFAAGSFVFIMNNIFSKPSEEPYVIQYLNYTVKYVFNNNRWLNAYDTWQDAQGGTGNQASST